MAQIIGEMIPGQAEDTVEPKGDRTLLLWPLNWLDLIYKGIFNHPSFHNLTGSSTVPKRRSSFPCTGFLKDLDLGTEMIFCQSSAQYLLFFALYTKLA
ncbi:hypothetical protein ILYODFUR_016749 [Ilyodon furcidens]|uniref:Uncharacterized protein n=1 Tax=Ilyodon furcidens TaxID=33524 RepID=A0ABV0TZE7_9TELE